MPAAVALTQLRLSLASAYIHIPAMELEQHHCFCHEHTLAAQLHSYGTVLTRWRVSSREATLSDFD
jgi:hypothetical protein